MLQTFRRVAECITSIITLDSSKAMSMYNKSLELFEKQEEEKLTKKSEKNLLTEKNETTNNSLDSNSIK